MYGIGRARAVATPRPNPAVEAIQTVAAIATRRTRRLMTKLRLSWRIADRLVSVYDLCNKSARQNSVEHPWVDKTARTPFAISERSYSTDPIRITDDPIIIHARSPCERYSRPANRDPLTVTFDSDGRELRRIRVHRVRKTPVHWRRCALLRPASSQRTIRR